METVQNSISKSSSKLVAYNTLHTAFDTGWRIDLNDQASLDKEIKWVVDAFDDLARALPIGKVGEAAAQKLRDSSVVRSAVLVQGYIALMCEIRELDGSPEEYFQKLPGSITLEADSAETVRDKDGEIVPRFCAGEVVDFFSYANPIWRETGFLRPNVDKKTGLTKMGMFNARQQRNNVIAVLRERVGLPDAS